MLHIGKKLAHGFELGTSSTQQTPADSGNAAHDIDSKWLCLAREISGRDMLLSKAVFLSNTHSSDSSRGLSGNNDSNTIYEPYCANVLVKHIIGQGCLYMGKISLMFRLSKKLNQLAF